MLSAPEHKIMWSSYTPGCANLSTKGTKLGLNANTAPWCFFENLAYGIIDMDFALKTCTEVLKLFFFSCVLKQSESQETQQRKPEVNATH